MTSKRFKGKTCAYCGLSNASTTADHIVAREFFFVSERNNIPKVPACSRCNGDKAKLEHYATATLMAGSRHADGDRYRREMVRPRLERNHKLQRELGIYDKPIIVNVNGILQPMYTLKIDAQKIQKLVGLIAKGLYFFHFKKPLHFDFYTDVAMFHPDHEVAMWTKLAGDFFMDATTVSDSLGNGSFIYEGARSVANEYFSVWRMAWHNGIALYGNGAPPQGVHVFWTVTRPMLAARETL